MKKRKVLYTTVPWKKKEIKEYHENGKLKIEGNLEFEMRKKDCGKFIIRTEILNETRTNDNPNGIHRDYYENGSLKQTTKLIDGVPNGLGEQYYENGKLEQQGELKNGEKQGVWKTYNENGNLQSEESYVDNIPNGILKNYYDNGQIMSKPF